MVLDTSHVSALSTVSTTSIYSPDGFSSRRKQVRGLEVGVHPHYRREMVILDAVAGLRVVGDDFPTAAGGARCRSASDEISERTSATAVSFMACARAPPNSPARWSFILNEKANPAHAGASFLHRHS